MKATKERKVGSSQPGADTHLFANPVNLTDILVVLCQCVVDLLDGRDLLLARLVGEGVASEGAAGFLEAIEVFLDPLDVLKPELGRDDVHVAARVDVALDVDDLGVIEGTDDLEDTIDGTDVRQEGVSKASTR